MGTISRLWASLAGLAGAIERLTGLVQQAADVIEARVTEPPQLGGPGEAAVIEHAGNGRRQKTAR